MLFFRDEDRVNMSYQNQCFDEFYVYVFLLMYFIIFLLETIYVCSNDH